jgi:hypothetical protein
MLLTFLQDAGLMDWVIIHLIFISVFAVSITINLFLLGRRLQRIEQRKIFDLEECRYDLQLLDNFRHLHTAEPKKGQFDGNTFQFFMDHLDERNWNLDAIYKDQQLSTTPEEALQEPVEVFQLGSAAASVKGKHDSGLHICCGCSKEANTKPSGYECYGLDWKCSAWWCDACLEVVKKQVTLWGDRARAYCKCGMMMAGNVTKSPATYREVHFEQTGRTVSSPN